MENLSKEDLELLCEALSERSRQLDDIVRTGMTRSIRQSAEDDYKKTHQTWEKVERIKQNSK